MATAYVPTQILHDDARRENRPGFFGRMLAHMLRAREMEARRRIAGYSYLISDEDLNNIGLTRRDLDRWHTPHSD